MPREIVQPTVIDIPALALRIGSDILSGELDYIPHAAEYGRCVLAEEAVPEETRRGMCLALSQPAVLDDYVSMVLLANDDDKVRMEVVRQAAVHVYRRSR